ncbi:peroxisome assembly protein 26-like [Amphiura filiformis]|uniref:peroxisome assembly protein 26-like n=1 Tax=Amphiura filiformis TaxID=82378 RepID=UPI003B2237E1
MDLESLSRQQIDGSRLLEVANDLLLFRKFDDVLKVCRLGTNTKQDVVFPSSVACSAGHAGLEHVDHHVDDGNQNGVKHNSVDVNSNEIIKRRFEESLCVLAIQAYAELDQWQHVEPFLTHCYGTPAAYPVKVVQLCILLYAKVHSYAMAEAILLQWLAFPDNQSQLQYSSILELYISQVLLPQGKVDEACELVQRTQCLKPDSKLNLLKHLKEVRERLEVNEQKNTDDSRSPLMKFVDRIGQLVCRFFPKARFKQIQN